MSYSFTFFPTICVSFCTTCGARPHSWAHQGPRHSFSQRPSARHPRPHRRPQEVRPCPPGQRTRAQWRARSPRGPQCPESCRRPSRRLLHRPHWGPRCAAPAHRRGSACRPRAPGWTRQGRAAGPQGPPRVLPKTARGLRAPDRHSRAGRGAQVPAPTHGPLMPMTTDTRQPSPQPALPHTHSGHNVGRRLPGRLPHSPSTRG